MTGSKVSALMAAGFATVTFQGCSYGPCRSTYYYYYWSPYYWNFWDCIQCLTDYNRAECEADPDSLACKEQFQNYPFCTTANQCDNADINEVLNPGLESCDANWKFRTVDEANNDMSPEMTPAGAEAEAEAAANGDKVGF